jgi:adenine phosphoribosyltransferase
MDLKSLIVDVKDFPVEGIIFKDITGLLADGAAFRHATSQMAASLKEQKPEYVVSIEARGFILASQIAGDLQAGFIPIRKAGKLPQVTDKIVSKKEYGIDELEINLSMVPKGSRVAIVDDVLATGQTIKSAINLLERNHLVVVGICVLAELNFLKGREHIGDGIRINSLISF